MATSILGSEKSSRPFSDFEFVSDSKDRPSRLGKGSFASVRLVQEKKTGKLFALKMINLNSSKISKSDLHNLRTEIQIHRQLDHPNIIRFNSYVQDGLNVYLVLDYAQNGNLYNYLHKKKILTPNEIFHFFYQTCLAVQYLHQKDFLHRDIKPENLLLDRDHNIKLCDFGWSAKSIKEKRITFCGTYEYMAPEIVRKKPYDYRVDIWSLGVLLYELVHREAPYKGRNLAEIINSLSKHTVTFSSSTQPEVKHLIEQILKIDPNERISISEILNHPWIKYHLNKREYIQQRPTSNNNTSNNPSNNFMTPTKPVYNPSLATEQDTYVSQDMIPAQEQLEDNLLSSYHSGPQLQSSGNKPVVKNLKIALNIQVPTLTINCTRLGEGNSQIQTTPRSVNQIHSVNQVLSPSPLPKKVPKENDCEGTPGSINHDNFYSNKGHSHSSSTLPKKIVDKWVLDSRKLSNDSVSRKLFEKDIMSPDFNIKLHSILGQLNVNPPTRREGGAGASVLTSRSNNGQQKSLNHISSTSFRGNEMPTARDNSVVRQMDQKENPHNATGDLSNLSLDNFKVKYSSDSKPSSRPLANNYMLNTPVQARGDPLANIHVPTFKINFTATKCKPDTAKSTPQKYFVFESSNPSHKYNDVNVSKYSSNNSTYDAMVTSLCKTTRVEEKPAYEGYLIQSSSLTDLQKKLLFKTPENFTTPTKGTPAGFGEKSLSKNKENRMETTRETREIRGPITYDKLYSQR